MRLALIDGSNFYKSCGSLGIRVDYKKLRELLDEDSNLLRVCYFTALRDKSIEAPIRKTVDWMSHNGYDVVSKLTTEFTDSFGKLHVKGNVDVELAVYGFRYAPHVKEIFLFSGDNDFTILIKELQLQHAVKVYVVSSMSMVGVELRKQADKFIDLADLKADIERSGYADVA